MTRIKAEKDSPHKEECEDVSVLLDMHQSTADHSALTDQKVDEVKTLVPRREKLNFEVCRLTDSLKKVLDLAD